MTNQEPRTWKAKKVPGESGFPRTIHTAVEFLLARMPDEMKDWLTGLTGDDIEIQVKLAAAMTPGMWARAALGLWRGNTWLLNRMPRGKSHPDSASDYLLVECRRQLLEHQSTD